MCVCCLSAVLALEVVVWGDYSDRNLGREKERDAENTLSGKVRASHRWRHLSVLLKQLQTEFLRPERLDHLSATDMLQQPRAAFKDSQSVIKSDEMYELNFSEWAEESF